MSGTEWPLRTQEDLNNCKPCCPPCPFSVFLLSSAQHVFLPSWSLITCTAWAGLCLYSWIHPFQGLFLEPSPSEWHNSRKSSKHGFSTGRNSLWAYIYIFFFLKAIKIALQDDNCIFPFNYNFTSRPFKWVLIFLEHTKALGVQVFCWFKKSHLQVNCAFKSWEVLKQSMLCFGLTKSAIK